MMFAAIKNEIKDSLFCFCMEQSAAVGRISVEEVENLTDKAFEVFGKYPNAHIDPISMYRYHFYAGEEYTGEIFPETIKENGVLCERCLHLGTFLAKEYSDNAEKIIMRGYDVVYDLDKEEIKLFYRVVFSDLLQKASADLKAFQERNTMLRSQRKKRGTDAAQQSVGSITPDNAEFKIEIGGKTIDERTDAGKEIENAIIKCSATGETVALGKYFGFGITIEKNPANTSLYSSGTPCVAVLHGNLNYTCEVSLGNDVGNVRRIENLAGNQINQKIQQLSASLDKAKNDLEEAKTSMAKPFERAEELANMQARLEFVNAELSKTQVDDEPVIVEPSEEPGEEDFDIADKINPRPKNIPPQNDEPPHKFRR